MTKLLVSLFIKDSDNIKNQRVRRSYGVLGSLVGIILNIILFGGKFIAGLISHSIAITADAFNNLSDAGASVITLIGFKLSGKPADNEHPFGHGRVEYVSGLIVAMAILLMGFELGKTSVLKLISPEPIVFSGISIVILCVSIIVKLWMSRMNRTLGRKISSTAMKATADDARNDCIATFAVLVGIVLSHFSDLNLDGIIGLMVAIFIIISGISTAKETLDQLLGEPPAEEFVSSVKKTVLSHKMVLGIHDMIVHNYGPGRLILSLHAEVDSSEDILKIHDEIDLIENELKNEFNCVAVIHMDPICVQDEKTIVLSNQVLEKIREIDESITMHDFRVVFGSTHTNLIFDLAVPYTLKMTDEEIQGVASLKIKEISDTYNAVIQIDRDVVY